jgi:hypothetical protein
MLIIFAQLIVIGACIFRKYGFLNLEIKFAEIEHDFKG